MRSKISSSKHFSNAIFVKNIKRLWPMWAGYSFIIFWFLYAQTFLELKFIFFSNYSHVEENTLEFLYSEAPGICLPVAVIFAILFALGNFGYLGKERSCYFMHSLPLTRENLFGSSFVSGLLMMYVPNAFFYILTNILCFQEGYDMIKPLSVWLMVICTEELFFFALAVLCMIVIGHNIAAPVIYGVVLGFSELIVALLNGIYSNLYYGVGSELVSFRDDITSIVSPIRFFARFYTFKNSYDHKVTFTYIDLWPVIIGGLVCGLIMVALGVILYKIRKSEHAGDIVAIDFIKPIFRWAFGISIALLITYLMLETLFYTWKKQFAMIVIVFVLIMLFGIVAYVAAEMMIKKSFRVFSELGTQFIVYIVCIAAATAAMLGIGYKAVKTVPKAEKVKSVNINVYETQHIYDDPAVIDEILKIHKTVIDNYKELSIESEAEDRNLWWTSIMLDYELDNRVVHRSYSVPLNDGEIENALNNFCKKHVLELLTGEGSDGKIVDATVAYFSQAAYIDNYTLPADKVDGLIAAIKKDIDEGNTNFTKLSQYFGLYTSADENEILYWPSYFELEIQRSFTNKNSRFYDGLRSYRRSYRLKFDSSCENAINYIQSLNLQSSSFPDTAVSEPYKP